MAEAHHEPFSYEALRDSTREIRLLQILNAGEVSSAPGVKIRCQLSTWRLEDKPEYIAVSYTWGDPLQTTSIDLDGGTFTIRENCRYVLRQAARHGMSTPYLWIDAICINQGSNDEKSNQVAIMGAIYRRAEKVYVCIGPQGQDSDHLFQIAQEHSRCANNALQEAREHGHLDGILKTTGWAEDRRKEILGQPGPLQIDVVGHRFQSQLIMKLNVRKFFESFSRDDLVRLADAEYNFSLRSYWHRLWIVQEILLGHKATVLCGESSLNLQSIYNLGTDFGTYCSELREKGGHDIERYLHPNYMSIDGVRNLLTRDGLGLLEMTERLSDFKCHDVRDRIFGLLAIVNWGVHKPIFPDYSRSALEIAMQAISCMLPATSEGLQTPSNDWDQWPIHSATHIAMALDLEPENEDIGRLLRDRRYLPQPEAVAQDITQGATVAGRVRVTADGYCQLFTDGDSEGDFTASLVKREWKDSVPEDFERDPSSQFGTVPFRTVSNRSGVCAWVSARAQAGDVIAGFPAEAFQTGLLLRKSIIDGTKYRIIGQALFDEDVVFCSSGASCGCSLPFNMHSERNKKLEIRFDPEDLLLFVCQSLMKDESPPAELPEATARAQAFRTTLAESSAFIDSYELQPLRLVTSVVKADNAYSSFADMVKISTPQGVDGSEDGASAKELQEFVELFNTRRR